MVVWKYELKHSVLQKLELPVGYKLLDVQVQRGIPCLWVLVDPKADKTPIFIRILGTGEETEHPLKEYAGTFQTNGGDLVFHVFVTEGKTP